MWGFTLKSTHGGRDILSGEWSAHWDINKMADIHGQNSWQISDDIMQITDIIPTLSDIRKCDFRGCNKQSVTIHYGGVIIGAIASQITSLTIVYRPKSKKTSKPRVTRLCAWNAPVTGEFPTQMASNAENVSNWCHHLMSWKHNVRCPKYRLYTFDAVCKHPENMTNLVIPNFAWIDDNLQIINGNIKQDLHMDWVRSAANGSCIQGY